MLASTHWLRKGKTACCQIGHLTGSKRGDCIARIAIDGLTTMGIRTRRPCSWAGSPPSNVALSESAVLEYDICGEVQHHLPCLRIVAGDEHLANHLSGEFGPVCAGIVGDGKDSRFARLDGLRRDRG